MNPQELKAILSSGLLSFPVTDFDAQGDFNRAGYVKRPSGSGRTAPGAVRRRWHR